MAAWSWSLSRNSFRAYDVPWLDVPEFVSNGVKDPIVKGLVLRGLDIVLVLLELGCCDPVTAGPHTG
jgi:hypothetical protein